MSPEDILNFVPVSVFPNLHNLLKCSYTYSVTRADVERANSALDFVKT